MQNKYVGDAGDFGKHGLLRRLCGLTDPETAEPDLRLGLAWYLFPDGLHGADKTKIVHDGKQITYLDPNHKDAEMHRQCDPDLWTKLRKYVDEGRRCVHCVQADPVLPENTLYHDDLLYYWPSMGKPFRQTVREHWFAGALRATAGADLVCLDPDNGIRWDGGKMFQQDGPKYTYLDDLRALWERGQSLVVYQHQSRVEVEDFVAQTTAKLRGGLDGAEPIPLRYRHGSSRVFFVLPKPAHREHIETRVAQMLDGPWGRNCHFERVGGEACGRSNAKQLFRCRPSLFPRSSRRMPPWYGALGLLSANCQTCGVTCRSIHLTRSWYILKKLVLPPPPSLSRKITE